MNQIEKSPKDNFKNAICYIPLVAFILHFYEDNKSKEFERNVKYGMYLFGLYFLSAIILKVILFFLPINTLLSLLYIGLSAYYGYKSYNGEDLRIEFLDKLDDKINNKNNSK